MPPFPEDWGNGKQEAIMAISIRFAFLFVLALNFCVPATCWAQAPATTPVATVTTTAPAPGCATVCTTTGCDPCAPIVSAPPATTTVTKTVYVGPSKADLAATLAEAKRARVAAERAEGAISALETKYGKAWKRSANRGGCSDLAEQLVAASEGDSENSTLATGALIQAVKSCTEAGDKLLNKETILALSRNGGVATRDALVVYAPSPAAALAYAREKVDLAKVDQRSTRLGAILRWTLLPLGGAIAGYGVAGYAYPDRAMSGPGGAAFSGNAAWKGGAIGLAGGLVVAGIWEGIVWALD